MELSTEDMDRLLEAHSNGGMVAVATVVVSIYLARASGQVKDDARALELTIDHASEDAAWEAKYSSTDRAALSRLQALAQESASLLAKVAELEATLEAAYLDLGGARAEVERLKARGWIQCTTVSNECLGGCASMAEHDRYRHRELAHEVESLRPVVVLHEDLSKQLRLAESRLAAVREALDAIRDGRRFRGEHVPETIAKVALTLEGDVSNPSMSSNGSDTMSTAQQHADLQRLTGATPDLVMEMSDTVTAVAQVTGSCTCAGEGVCGWCSAMSAAISSDAARTYADHTTPDADAYDRGADAMRAACWEEVQEELRKEGVTPHEPRWVSFKAAIEGATP